MTAFKGFYRFLTGNNVRSIHYGEVWDLVREIIAKRIIEAAKKGEPRSGSLAQRGSSRFRIG